MNEQFLHYARVTCLMFVMMLSSIPMLAQEGVTVHGNDTSYTVSFKWVGIYAGIA